MLETFNYNKAKVRCSVGFFEEINAFFLKENALKRPQRSQKFQKFLIFNTLMKFLANCQCNLCFRMVKTFKKAKTCCPVGFPEEIIAVF